MNDEERLDTALFRYRTIAPLLDPDTGDEAKRSLRQAITEGSHRIPHSGRTTISPRTLRRWLKRYREEGFDGLKPRIRRDKGTMRAIPEDVLAKARAFKEDLPGRSVDEVIRMLEAQGIADDGQVKPSTLSRYFRRQGLTRQELEQKDEPVRRRFERDQRNALWQGDLMHGPSLPDPADPAVMQKTYLVAWIDDYSRLVPHAAFYPHEKLPALEDSLKQAVLARGIPERIYVDQGKIYSSRQLGAICGELGIRRIQATPYTPEGKGKIERFFRTVRDGFLKEATLLELPDLDEVNQLFGSWLEEGYHHRTHGTTGETPAGRFAHAPGTIHAADPQQVEDIFRWRDRRTVTKHGTISLLGNRYEVHPDLRRKKVTLRFNPFDLTHIDVYYQDRAYGQARPLQVERTEHPQVDDLPGDGPSRRDDDESLTHSYLHSLDQAHKERLKEELGGIPFGDLFDDSETTPTDEDGDTDV